MTLQEISQRARGTHGGERLATALILVALMIEMIALIIGAALGTSYGDYFSNTKAVRDAASPINNPGILSQLGTVHAVEAWLVPFKFLGLAMFFAGIAAALATIIKNLQLRGEAFTASFPVILNRGGNGGKG